MGCTWDMVLKDGTMFPTVVFSESEVKDFIS